MQGCGPQHPGAEGISSPHTPSSYPLPLNTTGSTWLVVKKVNKRSNAAKSLASGTKLIPEFCLQQKYGLLPNVPR